MFLIEKLSNNIATRMASTLNLDDDNKEVLAYGAFTVLQTLWSFSLVVVAGLVFNVLKEAITISLTGAILRKYSGGAHATAPNRCAVIGVIMSVGLALVVNIFGKLTYVVGSIFILLCFLITYYCIFRYCPVDSPNKPIIKVETKTRLKHKALNTVHSLFAVSAIFYSLFVIKDSNLALNVTMSVGAGILSQAISLTSFGHFVIGSIDVILEKVSIK